jgi:L-alanine-DL-glutamate epimerase-like enolase superfamily enzyme
VNLNDWKFDFVQLDLKVTWKIARNSSTYKKNLLVTFNEKINDVEMSFQGESAPNIRYQETPERLEEESKRFKTIIEKAKDFDDLMTYLDQAKFSNCFVFAITSIFHQRKAVTLGNSFFEYLNLSPHESCTTSFSVPMLEVNEIKQYLKDNDLENSPLLKLKVRNSNDIPQYLELRRHFSGPIIIDANEGMISKEQWDDFISKLGDTSNIVLIEQPFPADQSDLYQKVMPDSTVPIFLDESILNQPITEDLKSLCHGINVKLMKSSDILLAKSQLEMARKLGLRTMIGCMIESSVAISQAFYLASLAEFVDLDGFALLIKDPGNKMSYRKQILRLENR